VRVVFLGPPGAGKGTQATRQAETLNLLYIATGDELRRAIAEGSPLGKKAKAYTDSGQLVPDDLIIDLVEELLEQIGSDAGVIFDGFPRTLGQAEALDGALRERGEALDGVLYFDASPEAIVERLSGRRVCRQCGATYHVTHLPPKRGGACDTCGGELYQRDDDRPETVRERLRVYERQTAALLDYYRAQGLLIRLDADQAIEEVRKAVEDAMDALARGEQSRGTTAGQDPS